MVAWEEQLSRGRVPEWADKYVDYAALKRNLERTFPEVDKKFRPTYNRAITAIRHIRSPKVKGNAKAKAKFEEPISGESETDLPLSDDVADYNDLKESLLSPEATETVAAAIDEFSQHIMSELAKAEKFYGEACDHLESKVQAYIAHAEDSTARGTLHSGRRDVVETIRRVPSGYGGAIPSPAGAGGLGGDTVTRQEELDGLYLKCVWLTEFALLNSEAARKIAKKFDKRIMSEGVHQDRIKTMLMGSALADKPKASKCTGERARKCRRRLEALLTAEHAAELRGLAAQASRQRDASSGARSTAGAFRPIRAIVASLLALVVGVVTYYCTNGSTNFSPEAQRCLVLLTFIVGLWVGEACPFEGTAMLVPPLAVLLGVIEGEGVHARATRAVGAVFSDSLYVALAGFVMTSVFASAGLDSIVADVLISRLSDRPKLFLLSLMVFGVLLSALISNVTAPLLIIEAFRPMWRDAPTDSRFSRSILLAIAFSCNAGGMATPISSPQNIAAMATLGTAGGSVEWAQWLAVSMPTCALTIFGGWICILVLHANDESDDEKKRRASNGSAQKGSSEAQRLHDLHRMDAQSLSATQCFSLVAAALALVVFAVPALSNGIGGNASASLLFVGVVVCAGAIPKTTFNGYSWHLLFLIGGGNALGLAVGDSGLLAAATAPIQSLLAGSGPGTLAVVLISCLAFATTFLSHTVAALVLMPLCVELGQKAGGHADAIALVCALACSSACALPFSSFPNVSCISLSDDEGEKYLTVMHFLRAGLPATFLTALSLFVASWPLAAMVLTAEPTAPSPG